VTNWEHVSLEIFTVTYALALEGPTKSASSKITNAVLDTHSDIKMVLRHRANLPRWARTDCTTATVHRLARGKEPHASYYRRDCSAGFFGAQRWAIGS